MTSKARTIKVLITFIIGLRMAISPIFHSFDDLYCENRAKF